MRAFSRRRPGSLDVVRRRIIRETEAALLYGLCFPDRVVRIPTMEVGRGSFDANLATRFWIGILGIDEAEMAAHAPPERRCGSSPHPSLA